MIPLFVSFYTTDRYADEAEELRKTLEQFLLPHKSLAIHPFGSWVRACSHKPAFIRQMRWENPGRPLIWLDADARVRKFPELLLDMPTSVDLAAHWLGDKELLSGTLYFGATPAADALLEAWERNSRAAPTEWDQHTLQRSMGEMQINAVRLPPEYTWIAAPDVERDISESMYGKREPVIVHEQASRRLKVI